VPVVDHGVDLLAYQVDPFRVAKIQVKGATRDLKVFRQYSLAPMIMSYVLDPLGAADVVLLTGEQAWNLPIDYVAHGGKASDHHLTSQSRISRNGTQLRKLKGSGAPRARKGVVLR